MKILEQALSRRDIKQQYLNYFSTMTKAVVDIERESMAIDAPLHADLELLLIEQGASQNDLWGINLYPDKEGESFVEFTALINIRPHQNNFTMDIGDERVRKRIGDIVRRWVIDA